MKYINQEIEVINNGNGTYSIRFADIDLVLEPLALYDLREAINGYIEE